LEEEMKFDEDNQIPSYRNLQNMVFDITFYFPYFEREKSKLFTEARKGEISDYVY
jgi:hypothetical protein